MSGDAIVVQFNSEAQQIKIQMETKGLKKKTSSDRFRQDGVLPGKILFYMQVDFLINF
jgi:hypothetical protein|tara:strand:+ start:254 stop:427 length:174 start_codon:yes stop_codon:yes gene_type:complete